MLQAMLRFRLPRTFPDAIGWTAAVRARAHDPQAHRFLANRYPRIFAGSSPAIVLATWKPLGREMLYYVRGTPGDGLSFLATDRFFLHEVQRGGSGEWPAPVRFLLDRCRNAWSENFQGRSCPLDPDRGGYPGALLVHDLARETVSLAVAGHSASQAQRQEACA